jgi:outer membrane lipoprotein-sorting protein
LAKLAQTWSAVHDYRVDIDANELVGESWHSRKIRYSLLRPNRARMEILDGSSRGTALVWDGGDRIHVRPGGIMAFLRLSFALGDPRASSERGNTIFTPDFGKVLECFAAHAEDVRVTPGSALEGKATTELTFEHAPGPVCSNDSTTDLHVTRDVVTILTETGLPLRRERFEGERSVERWDLRNLRINPGLTASDF